MSSTPNITKASSTKKVKTMNKGNVVDFESLSILSLKKYRSQFQIRIKPTVPKSELAAAIAEHFASIPVPEENEVIDQFLRALQKNRTASETEESGTDDVLPSIVSSKKSAQELKKRLDKTENNSESESHMKNSLQSNSKKASSAKRNSIPKIETKQSKV